VVAFVCRMRFSPQFGEHLHWTDFIRRLSWIKFMRWRPVSICCLLRRCFMAVSTLWPCGEVTVGGVSSADRRQDLDHMSGWLDGPTIAARSMAWPRFIGVSFPFWSEKLHNLVAIHDEGQLLAVNKPFYWINIIRL
jgi:hypothetical protein